MSGLRPQHTVIVGAGLAGLSAARDLALAGQRVTLVESAPTVGGLASSRLLRGETVEQYYHFICRDDESLVNLVQELGLGAQLHWRHTPTAFFHQGRHCPFGSPRDLLRFTPVPLGARFRVGWHIAQSVLQSDWRRLDGLSARAWLVDSIGEEAYKVIWHPLLRVKFGDEYDKVSAAWLWHRIVRVARSRHSWWSRSTFGYLTHGSATIVRALDEFLAAQPNVSVKLGTRVVSLDIQDNAVRGVRLDQGTIECSAVISTVALPVLDRLVPGQTSRYFDRIRQVRYIGLVCALFSLKRPFTSNFWLNINDRGISFNGIIEQTNLNRHLREAGLNVIYVPYYVATAEPRYGYTETELFDEYVPMLKRVNPEFDESWIEDFSVARTAYAQAVCHTHFAELRPEHRAPIRGLYVTDSTQFYPEDRTLSAAIEQGRKAASLCLEDGVSMTRQEIRVAG